jgi:hypothetical protein
VQPDAQNLGYTDRKPLKTTSLSSGAGVVRWVWSMAPPLRRKSPWHGPGGLLQSDDGKQLFPLSTISVPGKVRPPRAGAGSWPMPAGRSPRLSRATFRPGWLAASLAAGSNGAARGVGSGSGGAFPAVGARPPSAPVSKSVLERRAVGDSHGTARTSSCCRGQ